MSSKRDVWVEEGKIKVTPSSVCLLWPCCLWFCFEAYHKGSPLTVVTFPSRFGIWRNKSGLAPPLWFSHGVFKTKVGPLLAVLALGTSSALLICNSKYSSVGKTECSGSKNILNMTCSVSWAWEAERETKICILATCQLLVSPDLLKVKRFSLFSFSFLLNK